MTIGKSLHNSMVWNALNLLTTQLSGFVIFIIIAGRISPEVFGLVALAAVFADVLTNEGRTAGMDAIIQENAFDGKSLNSAFYSLMVVVAIFSAAMIVSAPYFAELQGKPLIGQFMPVFGILILFIPWLSVMDALIMRNLEFKVMTQRNMVSTLLAGAAGIGCAFSDWAIWALIVQRCVSVIVTLVFEYWHTRWHPGLHADRHRSMSILRRFFPLWAIGAFSLLLHRVATFVFGLRYSANVLGLLRAADRINESVQAPLVSPLYALWLPLMTRVRGEIDKEREIYIAIIRTAAFLSMPAFAGLIVVADDVVMLVLPERYAGVASLMRVLSIVSLTIPFVWFNTLAMNALNMNRTSLVFSMISVSGCIAVLLLARDATPEAALLLMSAPALLTGIVGNMIIHRRLKLSHWESYRGLIPAIMAAAVMGCTTAWIHDRMIDWSSAARLAVCVVTGVAIYFGWLTVFHRPWLLERIALLRGHSK